jgi:soluble lytic murein transglycosylase-like protein
MNAQNRYDSLFQYYGEISGVDWMLLKAQAIAESNLEPNAVSRVGAKGLTQFMDSTWKEWKDGTPGVQEPPFGTDKFNPFDPEDSIRAQAAYMGWVMKQFKGSIQASLMAYNWGIGNVKKILAKVPAGLVMKAIPEETRGYVTRIMKWMSDNKI